MATSGAFLSSTTLWNGLNEIAQLRNQIDQLFEQYDAILMPSIAALAWKAEERFPTTIDNETVGPEATPSLRAGSMLAAALLSTCQHNQPIMGKLLGCNSLAQWEASYHY